MERGERLSQACQDFARRLAQVALPRLSGVRVSESPPMSARLVNCAGVHCYNCFNPRAPRGARRDCRELQLSIMKTPPRLIGWLRSTMERAIMH
jgi:hypothetical protein